MELSRALLHFGAGRPHPLVVTAAGGTRARLAVEAELRRRGWPAAAGPAEADLLLVCGTVDDELAPYLERAWAALGAPRARVHVAAHRDAETALRGGQRQLADGGAPRDVAGAPARRRPARGDGGHDMAGEDHDMAGMEMELPAGLPMAERADDRDGLKLDQLHVPLGPVLPHWPAGLVVHTELQGDVIQSAEIETIAGSAGAAEPPFWDEPWLLAANGKSVARGCAERRRAAAHLDSLGRLLALAGWGDAATRARSLRDAALAEAPAAQLLPATERFADRVRRSRTLRWLTSSLGCLDRDAAIAAGVSGPALRAGGDVTARWQRWLDETIEALRHLDNPEPLRRDDLHGPRGLIDANAPPSGSLLAVLPLLLEGAELGGARLIVASIDPDLDELVPARQAVGLV